MRTNLRFRLCASRCANLSVQNTAKRKIKRKMVEEFAFDNTEERRKSRQSSGDAGWVEVIVGSMFSGKSEELIRRLRRAQIARQKVQVFKPVIDDRYSIEQIASHSGQLGR